MKKLLVILSLIIATGTLYAGSSPTRFGDQNGAWVGSEAQQSTITINAGQLGVNNPTHNPPIIILAPATASITAYKSVAVSTQPLITSGTTWTLAKGDYTDMITPRNITITPRYTVGTSTKVCTGTALVTGYDLNGNTQSESIAFTVLGGTGSYAWSSVTSYAVTVSSIVADPSGNNPDNVTFNIGSGLRIGVPALLDSYAEVVKDIENGVLITSYTYRIPYNTIQFAISPNGAVNYQLLINPKMR